MMLCLGAALGACSPAADDTLDLADAIRWLGTACGVTLSAPPLLQKGTWIRAADSPGRATRVEGTMVLAAIDVPRVLDGLRNNTALNLRGASVTRHSYQSPDGRPAMRECELDTATRQLYFLYTE